MARGEILTNHPAWVVVATPIFDVLPSNRMRDPDMLNLRNQFAVFRFEITKSRSCVKN